MNRHQLDELKNIGKSFNYNEDKETKPGPGRGISKSQVEAILMSLDYGEKKTVLSEETFDDFDTVYESLRSGVEMELKNFTVNLLSNNVEKFAWSFVTPSTETFADAWNHVLTKFTLRDDASRDQFLERIRILYRNIFLEKMGINDEKKALDLADKYYEVFQVAINQLLDKMKENQVGQSTPTAQDASNDELSYR